MDNFLIFEEKSHFKDNTKKRKKKTYKTYETLHDLCLPNNNTIRQQMGPPYKY